MARRGLRRGATLIVGVVSFVLVALPAWAQYPGGGNTPPVVKGEKFFRNPRTGSDVLLFVIVALVLMLLGFALRYLTKRNRPSEA